MKIFKRFIAAGLIFTTLSGAAVELLPVDKSPVIVFINGKKYYVHTVKSGDTLYSIAKAYEVGEDAIRDSNPGVADGLRIDQTVKIPVPESAILKAKAEKKRKKDYITHKVKAGQTLYAIARDYNISVATLREDNPSVNPQALSVGETLWIRRAAIGSSTEQQAQAEIAEYTDNLNKATDDDGFDHHVVKPGETIYSLSRRYGITEAEFAQLNDVSQGLKAGAIIRIPRAKEVEQEVVAEADNTPAQTTPGTEITFQKLDAMQDLNIALMLPMNINSKPNASYVEFYQGFLLGLDEVKKTSNGNTKLTVYNTSHDQLKVQQIVGSTMFEGTNLIVGPVYEDELNPVLQYAHKNSVPVVSPLANISAVQSPALYQLSPAPEKKYEKIGNLLDGGRDIYLIYASSNDKEFEQEIIKELHGRPYAAYNYSFTDQKSTFKPRNAEARAIESIDDILKGEKPCLFIVLANAETDVDRILGTISSSKVALTDRSEPSAQYVVMGTSRWGRFNNIDHTSYFNNNVVMISTYHAKRDSKAVRDFDSRYIEAYGALPSLYAYRGYDTAMIFCAGMRGDIEYNMLDKRYTPLQTTYKFVRGNAGERYINQEWVRVNYNNDYTITIE
ncbi:MAG: LysM peptidoglycan-binding domain-containing protein [Alistipes sp.]|nr:LysM peptidoglycan-binding domain-containing protein [Rikenellaceae bacterium]MBQ3213034.1 LysM peptidoglycan-binding domain-containing protein [Alistipes sp.]MBQ7787021.1 LysM peptidoglycan-binding domain-containing protein [Alistipes sp.]